MWSCSWKIFPRGPAPATKISRSSDWPLYALTFAAPSDGKLPSPPPLTTALCSPPPVVPAASRRKCAGIDLQLVTTATSDATNAIEASEGEGSTAPALDEDAEAEIPETESGSDRLQSLIGTDRFELKLNNAAKRPKQERKQTIQVWLPLSFPAIPAKGDFDVTRLKSSDYFFS